MPTLAPPKPAQETKLLSVDGRVACSRCLTHLQVPRSASVTPAVGSCSFCGVTR